MTGHSLTLLKHGIVGLGVGVNLAGAVTHAAPVSICEYSGLDVSTADEITDPMQLIPCLEASDPELRDAFAYSRFAELLRSGEVDHSSLMTAMQTLMGLINTADDDPNGFRGPFAMLALSEVVRTDRIDPWMTDDQRLEIAKLASDYLIALDDYRGFDELEGWRHGVAHTADVFLQLALNPAIGLGEAQIMLDAIAAKVAPLDAPAYVFGEPDRLARPVLFLARSGLPTDEDWTEFFEKLKRGDDPRWVDPYMHEAGLRALRNTKAFAYAIYVNATASATDADDVLADGALDLLASLP